MEKQVVNVDTRKDVTEVPQYGFKVRLDHEYPEKWSQKLWPRLSHLSHMLPMSWRYILYYRDILKKGRLPIMDFVNTQEGKQIYGAPIGGLGAGTIGRGFKGEFCRYALVPGLYQYNVVDANRFIVTVRDTDGNTLYQRVLSPLSPDKRKNLSSWDWNFDGKDASYTALYPRSWTVYEIAKYSLRLVCRQISPVIPNNYKDSSLPCAVFVWEIINTSNCDYDVSITFTFQSGQGENSEGDKWNESFKYNDDTVGVMIHQALSGMSCTYAIATRSRSDLVTSCKLSFDPLGSGQEVWNSLSRTGKLDTEPERISEKTKKHTACAVCVSALVRSGKRSQVEFSLVWDMPKINFRCKKREYMRYYSTYFYDSEKSVAPKISHYSLSNYSSWENEIYDWQSEILNDNELPDWYKSALFNELYYVADGGTVWLRCDETNDHFPINDPRHKYGRFAYLEGHEYRMYNTYDVHFYASFALSSLWPNLQASLQYEIRDSVHRTDDESRTILFDGTKAPRKVAGFVPHDIGDPGEEPFVSINSYPIHDVSRWKDLNPKFVLTCYRDYVTTGSIEMLRDFWPTLKEIVERSLAWDKDEDGLIENSGFPDQTYDTWTPLGPSSYCGSLWLGALRSFTKIAEILDHTDTAKEYNAILAKGRQAFQDKLWNGKYYNFDDSGSKHHKAIMSDQLCGQWFMQACGFGHEIFPEDRVRSSLETIFSNNVMKFKDGKQGAVNGFIPDVGIDTMTLQSEEMWTGVTYGLAALMIHEGMVEEAFHTAEGVYRTIYEKIGLAFETPEALQENKVYRSVGYMRPLAIWGIQYAWKMHKDKDKTRK